MNHLRGQLRLARIWRGLAEGLALLLLAALYRWQHARQRAAQALEARRLADLQVLDRAKTTFFTNISHELRTPLALILGPAEVLVTYQSLPPALREYGLLVRRNARKLLRLTNQLLDLSKLEAVALRLVPTPGDAAQAGLRLAGALQHGVFAAVRIFAQRGAQARRGGLRSGG